MEAEKIKKFKRCRHYLREGTCSLCLGMPPSLDQRDIFNFSGTRSQLTGTLMAFAFEWLLDDDLVQENAQSLL